MNKCKYKYMFILNKKRNDTAFFFGKSLNNVSHAFSMCHKQLSHFHLWNSP